MLLTAMILKNEGGKYALTAMLLKNWMRQLCFDCYGFENEWGKYALTAMILKIEWGNYVLILLRKMKQSTIFKLTFWTTGMFLMNKFWNSLENFTQSIFYIFGGRSPKWIVYRKNPMEMDDK